MVTSAPRLGVYIHWPYCARICPYCDFNVYRHRGHVEAQASLVQAILKDLSAHRSATSDGRLGSIYFGGGTPSLLLPEDVARVITHCRALWPASNDLEITLEANPTDAEAERFSDFAKAGVNRLSLGLQSLNDDDLKRLGRNHSAQEAAKAANLARSIFPSLSLDLIYALPDQTRAEWRQALRSAIAAFSPDHVSPYQLTVEAGTALERASRRGQFSVPAEQTCLDLYEDTQSVLETLGFEAYEVSNHARSPSARSRHNLTYWRGETYIGVGPGAHGRLETEQGWMATEAALRPSDYVSLVDHQGFGHPAPTLLSPAERAEERVIMGLRSTEGVAFADLTPLELSADAAVVREIVELGLLDIRDRRLIATRAGRRVLNAVAERLITHRP